MLYCDSLGNDRMLVFVNGVRAWPASLGKYPNHQHAEIALTAIYGIGRSVSRKICVEAALIRPPRSKI